MATRTEANTVKVAAVIQGVALVTFPAASTIFTDPDEYDLSSTQYGAMFIPQAITAISASLAGAALSRRLGTKKLYVFGLLANLVAMSLLVVSQFFTGQESTAYALLLLATASLGVGFGLTVPALNTFTAAFNPEQSRRFSPRAECTARPRHGLGPRFRRPVRRSRVLVGPPGSVGCPARDCSS